MYYCKFYMIILIIVFDTGKAPLVAALSTGYNNWHDHLRHRRAVTNMVIRGTRYLLYKKE